jgi:hypothetical protein
MRITLICCLLLLTFTLVHAQESTPEPADGWTIEQRCVAEPTTPPDDWSFDGTIFTRGTDNNIRGLHADLDSPYIIAFSGSDFTTAGAFSPDGRWFAVPSGTMDYYANNAGSEHNYHVEELVVYNTDPSHETYRLDWDALFHGSSEQFGVEPVYWLDNEHFAYVSGNAWMDERLTPFIVNPFTAEITQLPDDALQFNDTLSPDGSRIAQVNENFSRTLYNAETGEIITALSGINIAAWRPDSTGFLGNLRTDDLHQVGFFDADGNLLEIIADGIAYASVWSADNHHFAYTVRTADASGNITFNFYIGDTETRTLAETCIYTGGWSWWSAEGDALAFTFDSQIAILDTQNWAAYILDSEAQQILGWRADD